MLLLDAERAAAAWRAAQRRADEEPLDSPLRPLVEQVAERYRIRYQKVIAELVDGHPGHRDQARTNMRP